MRMLEQVEEAEGLGLGSLDKARLCQTLRPGTKLYCDRFFTSIQGAEQMMKKELYMTGTVMKNRVAATVQKLPTDKAMKKAGRDGKVLKLTVDFVEMLEAFYLFSSGPPVYFLEEMEEKNFLTDSSKRLCESRLPVRGNVGPSCTAITSCTEYVGAPHAGTKLPREPHQLTISLMLMQ
ncbi:hypothetical protein EXN66_Car001107 [Channa argus]|uniref:PiggyBac transposable element-derived protein domain-containing protein n=1 Tax=Channa argus TaxID=215402 RepID=A0A6G1QZM3_CHAAH|nr:hypothetical protein EXN66_Car001107 [Channa argus]